MPLIEEHLQAATYEAVVTSNGESCARRMVSDIGFAVSIAGHRIELLQTNRAHETSDIEQVRAKASLLIEDSLPLAAELLP